MKTFAFTFLLTVFLQTCLPVFCAEEETIKTDTLTAPLSEVIVTGTRSSAEQKSLPVTVNVIDRKKLTACHQTSILPTVMQQVPGLFVTSRGVMGYGVSGGSAGNISMRGLSGGIGQMLVLIDGHPQYNGIYGHPIADSYQTMMAQRVEVLRGPASMIYGSNAAGGVINIITENRREGFFHEVTAGAGSYGSLQAEAASHLKSGRFSTSIAGQYLRSDNHLPRMGYEQYGGDLKMAYELSSHWRASAHANLTHFSATQPGTTAKPLFDASQWITRGAASVALENHYRNFSGAVSVYTSFGRHKINDGVNKPDSINVRLFRSKDAMNGLSWYETLHLPSWGTHVTVGADYQHTYGRAYYTSTKTGAVLNLPVMSGHSHRNEVAGYIDVRQDITTWLTADAGVRLNHHSVTGTEWIPQAGLVVRPTSDGELKVMAGKGFRNPTMKDLYLYKSANDELQPERIWNYELSWRQRIGNLSYGANLFYLKGDNIIQTVNVGNMPQNMNTGKVENCGMEAEAAWQVNSLFTLNTNHALLHMHNKVLAAPIYKGFLGTTCHYGPLTANLGLQYIGHLITALPTANNTEKRENICLLDASIDYQVIAGMKLWIRGENLLAQKYEINSGYPMPRATFMSGVSMQF